MHMNICVGVCLQAHRYIQIYIYIYTRLSSKQLALSCACFRKRTSNLASGVMRIQTLDRSAHRVLGFLDLVFFMR